MKISSPDQVSEQDSRQSRTTATVKVFTKNQLNIAAFFGTALAAAYILKKNYHALGKSEEGTQVLLQGIFLILAVWMILVSLPVEVSEKIPGIAFSFFYLGLANLYFKKNQQVAIESMIVSGTSKQSGWRVFLIALIGFAASMIVAFLLSLFFLVVM